MPARHTFTTMGTTVSIHAVDAVPGPTLRAVEKVFSGYDERFSLYRPDSELSRIADGRLALTDSSPAMRDAYEQAIQWRTTTRGAFTPHRPDGVVDLSGIVKALAIRDAGAVLDASIAAWSLGCGGDILIRGADEPYQGIGITDPADRTRLLTVIELAAPQRAVATSGVSERGEHVWGPRADFDQVTVVAEDVITADVLATAVLAGGRATCDEAAATPGVDILAVQRDGVIIATSGIRPARARI